MIFFSMFFGVLGFAAALWAIRYIHIVIPVVVALIGLFMIWAWVDWSARQHSPEAAEVARDIAQYNAEEERRGAEAAARVKADVQRAEEWQKRSQAEWQKRCQEQIQAAQLATQNP